MSAPPGRDDPGRAASDARSPGQQPAGDAVVTAGVHLMRAAAVRVGLGPDQPGAAPRDVVVDIAEARVLITALAGLVTAATPHLTGAQARQLREGLRSLQIAFRDACPIPDRPGEGPGERWTGPVFRRSPDDPAEATPEAAAHADESSREPGAGI
jgi:hypothetical protein